MFIKINEGKYGGRVGRVIGDGVFVGGEDISTYRLRLQSAVDGWAAGGHLSGFEVWVKHGDGEECTEAEYIIDGAVQLVMDASDINRSNATVLMIQELSKDLVK